MKRQTITRKEKALQTRRRILSAAYRAFCDQGYAATTMELIAAEAGVAVQTLYFTFHTKGAILGETLGAAIVGFEQWAPRREPVDTADPATLRSLHAWFAPLEAEANGHRALALFIDTSVEILRRAAPLVSVMSAATADPDARAVQELAERRRADGYRTVARLLSRKGGLRRGLSVARATDILLTLLSGETYHALATGRGWSAAACRRWFADVLSQQLLPPPD